MGLLLVNGVSYVPAEQLAACEKERDEWRNEVLRLHDIALGEEGKRQLVACQKKAIEQWGDLAAMTKERDAKVNCIRELTEQCAALVQEKEELKRKAEMDYAMLAGDNALITGLKEQLAATEALLAQYRAALEYVASHHDIRWHEEAPYWTNPNWKPPEVK